MSLPEVPNLPPVTISASRLRPNGPPQTEGRFRERALRFTFSGAKAGVLTVEGLRAVVSIQVFQGRLGVAAQARIWGLSMAQMNTYSAQIDASGSYQSFNLAIEAGDAGGPMHKVVDGAIWRSYIDLTDSPESAFNVTVAPLYIATQTIASQSKAGPRNAEELISSICASAGMTLHNNGAHAVLRNHTTYGSAIDQIENIARAARFNLYFEGSDVYIWPPNGQRDSNIIEVGPDTGMVNYPMWWESGFIVQTVFDQRIQVGRMMKVHSSIPKANGTWQIIQVNHDLSTMLEKGPWFTSAVLAANGPT